MALSHQLLGFVTGREGNIEQAREHADLAVNHFEIAGDRVGKALMRVELAGWYLNVQQYEKTVEQALEALPFLERIKHQRLQSSVYNHLAEAHYELGDNEQARAYAMKVIQLEIPRSQPYAYYTLGLVHQREGNVDHAETVFKDGIAIARQNEDDYIRAHLSRNLGKLFRQLQRDKEAHAALQASLTLFRQIGLQAEVEATEQLLRPL